VFYIKGKPHKYGRKIFELSEAKSGTQLLGIKVTIEFHRQCIKKTNFCATCKL
jgi:hypothetical protein